MTRHASFYSESFGFMQCCYFNEQSVNMCLIHAVLTRLQMSHGLSSIHLMLLGYARVRVCVQVRQLS